jgi:ACS family hexuronate transporter-like MFS transporter
MLYPSEGAKLSQGDESATLTKASRTRGLGWHWLPIAVFVLYAAINMLDRQLLSALAPVIRKEYHLTNAQYGGVTSVFFAVTTFVSPLAGIFMDRVGLALGASVTIVVWSIAGAATGFTQTLRGLMACRFGLAVGESGGGAAPGALLSRYMDPGQLGIGAGMLASGTSLGAIAAPLVAAALAPRYGWRSVFILCGILGLLWVPLWLFVGKLAPPRFQANQKARLPLPRLLVDRRFWGLIISYALARQTLWVAWTTLYFVDARGLTVTQANQRFSWYPSVFGAVGALVAGAIAMHWIRKGMGGLEARLRTCWTCMPLLFLTAAVPFIPSTGMAAVAVGISFFGSVCVWTCTHLMPIDLYGVHQAAFIYGALESGFTGVQTLAAPAIGAMVDHYGYTEVCLIMPWLPLLGLVLLQLCLAGHHKITPHAS